MLLNLSEHIKSMNNIKLINGISMPTLGYGVFQIDNDSCARCVSDALACGYRLIDTAQAYYNEEGVGKGIKQSGVPRSEIFITDKVWISNAGDGHAMQSIERSLKKLDTDYIDLMLIHQAFGDCYGTYRDLEKALQQGKVRAIGLSNFLGGRFIDLAEHFEQKPMVLQAETNVFHQQRAVRSILDEYGTKLMAWAPLAQGLKDLYSNEVICDIANTRHLSPAQVALAFLVCQGIIAIPKSSRRERMEENLQAVEVNLSAAEMDRLSKLDDSKAPAVSDFNEPNLTRFLLNYDAKFNPERQQKAD